MVSPAGSRGRLSILIFHRVLPRSDALLPDIPDAQQFETQMRWVRDWFKVMPLAEGIERLYRGDVPPRAAAVSFDDGYADNEAVAAPILQRLGMTATFFVSTGYLDGSCMWNDRVVEAVRACTDDVLDLRGLGLPSYPIGSLEERRKAVVALILDVKHFDAPRRQSVVDAIVAATRASAPTALMMSPAQVRHLRTLGMDVGAHTVMHPILTRVTVDNAHDEIAGSKRHLEQLLDAPVPLFAYPNGHPWHDYAAEHVELVRQCGFSAAVTTAPGVASMRSDRFQLPRFAPWDRTRLRYGVRLMSNFVRREEVVS
jgi:peptidoglycan/xylan/chitin deacetylase (PgdA/CDA1 family)